jgi:hypothetical protein
MGYVYRRKNQDKLSAKKTSTTIDPLFAEGIEIVRGGFDCIREWADKLTVEKMHSGPHTGTRQRRGTRPSDTAGRVKDVTPTVEQVYYPPGHSDAPTEAPNVSVAERREENTEIRTSCYKQNMDQPDDRIPRKLPRGQNHNAGESEPSNDNVGTHYDSSPERWRDDRGSNNDKNRSSQKGYSRGSDFGGGRYHSPNADNNGGAGESKRFKPTNANVGRHNDSSPERRRDDRGSNNYQLQEPVQSGRLFKRWRFRERQLS